ncbi:MAG: type I pullulanase, partial [Treponema sp.]|nr:type I pullulanase [Treponema sp.]
MRISAVLAAALLIGAAACSKTGGPPEDSAALIIHYYRYGGDYAGWNLWVWPADGEGRDYAFGSKDGEGYVSARILRSEPGKEYGMIVRRSEEGNDWAEKDTPQDRFTGADEVWLLQSDPAVYTQKPDIPPAPIIFATADSPDTVTALLPQPPEDYGAFAVYERDRKLPGKAVKGKVSREVIISLEEPIGDPAKYYVVRDESGVYADKALTMGNILDRFFYEGDDLGLSYRPRESRFKVWAPTASAVSVALYHDGGDPGSPPGEGGESPQLYRMDRDLASGMWQVLVPGDLRGRYYLYRVEFPDGTVNWAVDPYARAVGVNGLRGMVIDTAATDPPGFREDPRPSLAAAVDAVIYELHVRDLSMHPRSGIVHQGKFLGLAESGTKNAEGLSTGLDHIRELGVTHIHLLPSFDFKTIDEANLSQPQFNWGYDPFNYNTPEGSYATDPFDGAVRVREFKELIQTLHRHGLGVIMDVVYNHTYSAEGSCFSSLVPAYYYRTDSGGRYTDGSACGNETASERPMVGKFIVDSVSYWAREYRIDGFRFDLMGLHDIDTMNAVRRELDKIDPSIIVYGEGWIAQESPLPASRRAVKANAPRLDEGIAVFSDDIRDGVKGSVFYAPQGGFVNGGYIDGTAKRPDFRVEDVKFGILGAVEHPQLDLSRVHYSSSFWAKAPGQTINYVSAHDNLTLWDKLAATNPEAGDEDLIKMNKLAAAIVLTSQGIPFFQAGEEMARTKGGDDNSYKSPDEVNMLDWDRKSRFMPLVDYYRGLIALRKTYGAFRLRRAAEIQERLRFLPLPGAASEGPLIAYTLENDPGDSYARFTLIFNGSPEEALFPLPPGDWEILVNGEQAGTKPLGRVSRGSLRIPGKTALVLGQV